MLRLKQLTEELMKELDILHEQFNKRCEIDPQDSNYFAYVKEELNDTFLLLDQWYQLVLEKINQRALTLPISMIEATKDNMNQLMLHSYYYDVRIRRYNELKKSCLYVFHMILDEINEAGA